MSTLKYIFKCSCRVSGHYNMASKIKRKYVCVVVCVVEMSSPTINEGKQHRNIRKILKSADSLRRLCRLRFADFAQILRIFLCSISLHLSGRVWQIRSRMFLFKVSRCWSRRQGLYSYQQLVGILQFLHKSFVLRCPDTCYWKQSGAVTVNL